MGNAASTEISEVETSPCSPTTKRRIVKAVKPVPTTLEVPNTTSDNRDDDHDDDDAEDLHGKKWSKKSKSRDLPILESASVAREVELEKLEVQKKERLLTMKENQRARREKRLDERRKKDPSPDEPPTPSTTYNPFSRFLSVFSVEPAHPEHKRSYELSEDDDLGPTEKRLRETMESSEHADKRSIENGKFGMLTTGTTIIASVAAVVAIAAALFLRAKRTK